MIHADHPRRPPRRRSWLAALPCALLLGAAPADPPGAVSLEVLLERLSRTALLFRDTALQFACKETISWSGAAVKPGGTRFEYLLVYDEKEGFKDFRTAVSIGPRHRVPQEINPRERGVPVFLEDAYLWIFAFRESRRPLHRYQILGTETVLGIRAVKVAFEPIPPYRYDLNNWLGVAWVDPALGQLLKVVAQRPFDYERGRDRDGLPADELVDEVRDYFEVITTWYTEEKNGLRFPGLVEIEQSRYLWRSKGLSPKDVEKLRRKVFEEWSTDDGKARVKKRRLLVVKQKYHDYEFFSVRAAGEIGDFILRGRRPGE